VRKEEKIIDQIEAEEDGVRDHYHCVKNQMDRADENVRVLIIYCFFNRAN
jgi:hypothetical protein